MKYVSFLIGLVLTNVSNYSYAQVDSLVINEICSSNIDQWIDPSFNYGGWIELYNPTSSSIDIKDCYISDDANNLCKAKILQSARIPANGFHTLWFGHFDSYWTPNTIDLKLDYDGGSLFLSDKNGDKKIEFIYPSGVSRCSWARMTDGGCMWSYCSYPTPGKTNNDSKFAQNRLDAPLADTQSHTFIDSASVKVTIPEGCTLIYTIDGSAPSLTNGDISSDGLFSTTETKLYRFRLFMDDYLPSPITNCTLIKNDLPIDLPIVSIVGSYNDYYGDSLGIFTRGVNGRPGRGMKNNYNWNNDWERSTVFEYMTSKGELIIGQELGIERFGGWSRALQPYSFKAKAGKKYEGINTIAYPFFNEKPYLKHKTLLVRNGGSDYKCRVKDATLQQIVARSGLDIDYQAYQPVAHFTRGSWYGTINLREPNNKDYVEANYGYNEDEIDFYEMSPDSGYVQKCGDYVAFQQLLDLSQKVNERDNYILISNLLDIDEFCNYMAVEFYVHNTDWPQNNLKSWRPRYENGKFRFILFDLDNSFEYDFNLSPFNLFEDKQIYTFDKLYGVGISYITKEIEIVNMFLNLLDNDTFRKKFIDTFCLITYSVFEPERCAVIINEIAERVAPTQLLNNQSPWKTANTMLDTYKAELQEERMNYLKEYKRFKLSNDTPQNATLQCNIDGAKLMFNGMPIPTNKFSGKFYSPLTVSVSFPAGYKFNGWRDATNNEIVSTNPDYKLPTIGDMNLVADFAKDSSCINLHPVIINEMSANNRIYINDLQKKTDWIELYNSTSEEIDLNGYYLTNDNENPLKWKIGSEIPNDSNISTIIPAHGYRIIWCDQLDGIFDLHAPFKLDNEDGNILMLTAPDESWHDSLIYCEHGTTETIGRYPDASRDVYKLTRITIGKTNQYTSYSTIYPDSKYDPGNIEYLEAGNEAPVTLYNLQGIRINAPLQKRIYIENGKIVIKR